MLLVHTDETMARVKLFMRSLLHRNADSNVEQFEVWWNRLRLTRRNSIEIATKFYRAKQILFTRSREKEKKNKKKKNN